MRDAVVRALSRSLKPSCGVTLEVTQAIRREARVAPRSLGLASDEPLESILAACEQVEADRTLVLTGGEPTLRADLPAIITCVVQRKGPAVTLLTDGLALAAKGPIHTLITAGLEKVRVTFFSGRVEAGDWLAGIPGATKAAVRAMRSCRSAGLNLEAEVVVCRPTIDHLDETVLLLARLGIDSVRLRCLEPHDVEVGSFSSLAPRLALTQPHLERAIVAAASRRLPTQLIGFPPCRVGPAGLSFLHPIDEPLSSFRDRRPVLQPCLERPRCEHGSNCHGAPSGHVTAFGWSEVDPTPLTGTLPTVQERPDSSSTRVAVVHFGGSWPVTCQPCRKGIDLPPKPMRKVRRQLLEAAREGHTSVALVGGVFTHPRSHEILDDACRLPFEAVEVIADGATSDDVHADLSRVKSLSLPIDLSEFVEKGGTHGRSNRFMRVTGILDRAAILGVATSMIVVIHDLEKVDEIAAVWPQHHAHELAIHFCGDGNLNELADITSRLTRGPARSALERLLPQCLTGITDWSKAEKPRSQQAIELPNSFTACPEASSCARRNLCPGLVFGWSATGITAVPEHQMTSS